MHKEVVMRKRTPVIFLIVFIITLMIYAYEALDYLGISNLTLMKVANGMIILSTICIIIFELIKCKIAYKYSIIANKLIINRIFLERERNIESITISDIVYIGSKSNLRNKYEAKFNGSYLFRLFENKCCCCVYKKNEKYYKFNFAPSDELLRRLNSKLV